MAIFSYCSVVLDLKNVPYKDKKKLTTAILDNGGNISYIVNQKCSFVVVSSLESMSKSKQRSAQKHQTPVVSAQYVWSCLEEGQLLPVQEHILKAQSTDFIPEQAPHPAGLKSVYQHQPQNRGIHDEKFEAQVKVDTYVDRIRLYKKNDPDIPEFPSDCQVAKYSILAKVQPKTWTVLELQSAKGQAGQQYRVLSSIIHEAKSRVVLDQQVHSCRSENTLEAYVMMSKELQNKGFTQTETLPPWAEKLMSRALQEALLEEKLNCSTVSLEVGVFVELIWTEALGSLNSILTVPVTSISLNDVSRVEGLLLQVQKNQCEDEIKSLLEEVNTLLPLRMAEPDSKNKLVSQKLDICQLIRDILNITEGTLGNPCLSSLGKYRALRCSIEQVPSESPEFLSVSQHLKDKPAQVKQIMRVSRGTELHMFRNELGNIKPLLHSTASSSLVGILSRGLLLPRVGVEQHGIERTDIGNLGSGIYFTDSLNTSVKYSKPSVTDGSRLLLVCEVALGQCQNLYKRDITLTSAPEGYNSVHGVQRTQKTHSDFEDDEYVVYNTDQIRLKYIVQYTLPEDKLKVFQPCIDTTLTPFHTDSSSHLLSSDDGEGLGVIKNPLEEVTAGLLDSNGEALPLQAVHVRCKLMDLLAQVVIFQTYTNKSSVSIEAKYVFPLEETAAVCGFEAFINGKHVIGKVKEKERARKEYKQAIEKGHGAYLMDQDAPDVFTISVGNLPPDATVLIKVTFITELVVRAGTIVFSLPGSVAPWQQSSALNQRTQTTVEKVRVDKLDSEGEFSLCMSIQMPYEILNLECSHQIQIKSTDCNAVVRTLPDQTFNTDGFRLSFTLSQIHMPRMWVEKHPEKDSEACMLVFYPHFESSEVSQAVVSDVIIVLDSSESMRGDALLNARRIALKVLNSLDSSLKVNIVSFGSDYKEAFSSPNLLSMVFEDAKNFIMSSTAVGGSTELWRPLRTLNLLPPSCGVRNILLISDGHVQCQPQTLQLVRENVRHTRFFTCGVSPTANRYMLRALAQAGGGTYEFFDKKTKHTWSEKVNSQVRYMVSPGCSSVAVKWQQFNPSAPTPVQAPSQLHALFSDCHTLVYGFVPHCTQATLFGDLSGQELETMVSTTELQKTKGKFLHKLTARAIIRDYEDGSLGFSEAEHEGKKAELKSYIIELSKEFSILSQFTSFVAVEERDKEQPDSGFTDVPKIIAEEDVDILSYMGWTEHKQKHDQESDRLSQESGSLKDLFDMVVSDSQYMITEGDAELNFRHLLFDECECSDESDEDMGFGLFSEAASSASSSSLSEDIELQRQRHFTRKSLVSRRNDSSMDYLAEEQDLLVSRSERVLEQGVSEDNVVTSTTLINSIISSTESVKLLTRSPPVSGMKGPDRYPHETSGVSAVVSPQCDFVAKASAPVPHLTGGFRGPSLSERFKVSAISPPEQHLPFEAPGLVPRLVGCFGGSSPYKGFEASAISPPEHRLAFKAPGFAPPPPPPPTGFSFECSSQQLEMRDSANSLFGSHAVEKASASPHSFILGASQSLTQNASLSPLTDTGVSPLPPPPPLPPLGISFQGLSPSVLNSAFGIGVKNSLPSDPVQGGTLFSSEGFVARPLPSSFTFGAPFPASASTSDLGVSQTSSHGVELPLVHHSQRCMGSRKRTGSAYEFKSLVQSDVSADSMATDTLPDDIVSQRTWDKGGTVLKKSLRQEVQESAVPQRPDAYEMARLILKYSSMQQAATRRFPRHNIQREQYRQPDRINWDDLFKLQHQDGYWECTGTLSKFLGLDVDFFAHVFLKEKGICSLGTKAHADILKLAATMLVLQLMRAMKMTDKELFQSLFRLTDTPEPRPACWEALNRAVKWVTWADGQYPCVYSRLEFGLDWESCTRQLLRLDSLPPCSPLIPVLQRSVPVM